MSTSTGTPVRRRLSALERVDRDRAIAEARADGVPWAAIAERFGLSVRQARRAEREYVRSAGSVVWIDFDGPALLARAIEANAEALDRLADLAAAADNDSARVGAARAVAPVSANLVALLRDARLIPSPPVFGFDREFRRLTGAILDIAERRGVGSLAEVWSDLDREGDRTRLALEVAR